MSAGEIFLLIAYPAVFVGIFAYQLGRWHEAKALDDAQRRIFKRDGGAK